MSLTLIVVCLIVGLLIGAVGVGGVLLVPALSIIGNIDVHSAIPASMLAYLATGVIGAIVYARQGSIKWDKVFWLCLGAVPSSFLGSISLLFIPAPLVMFLIAFMMIFAGIDALLKSFRPNRNRKQAPRLLRRHFIVIGFITGFGSSITGTGGPLILIPIVIFLGLPVLTAVGLSQAIQVPIAIFASIGNWMSGNLDIKLGLVIAAAMVVGTFVGAILIHRLPGEPIRKFLAFFLVLVGIGIAFQQLLKLQLF